MKQVQTGLSRRTLAISSACFLALTLVVGSTSPAQSATAFEQVQRANSVTFQTSTDTFASSNRFGSAMSGSLIASQLQSGLDSSVANGSLTWLFQMPGLSDLSGANSSPFSLGVANGFPAVPEGNPTTYDGTADLDWWYSPAAFDAGEDGTAVRQLPASFTAGVLTAGPGTVRLIGIFPAASLEMWGTNVKATAGSSSAVTQSSNDFPPGYLPDDEVSGVSSFASMTSGKLSGNITAASLAAIPILPGLASGGVGSCSQGYTLSHSMLDVIVGGCTVFGQTQITPSQPDKAITAGETYTLQANASRFVTTCRDKTNQVVDLAPCLADAAYSAYLTFTTDRVIVRKPCPPGSYSGSGITPCTFASPGFYAAGYGNTTQTACPEGTTSGEGASSCGESTVTTVECLKNPVQIGIETTCEGLVTNQSETAATGALNWSDSDGGGIFSSDQCTLIAGLEGAACSVTYRPSPGSAGTQAIAATYEGDGDHVTSDDEFSLQVTRRKSSTAVACKPMTIDHGKSTSCVVTVADASSGTKVSPTGKVEWSAKSSYGSFNSTKCTLSSVDGAKRCTVKFITKNSARGRFTLTATYLGGENHRSSSKAIEPKVI